jgi:hypothetical protein
LETCRKTLCILIFDKIVHIVFTKIVPPFKICVFLIM